MNIALDCFPCLVRLAVDVIRRSGAAGEQADALGRAALEILRQADPALPAPFVAREINRAVREATGCSDPFADIKRSGAAAALRRLPRLREVVHAAADPFRCAAKLALAGNVIDFGAPAALDLETILARLQDGEPTVDHIAELERQAGAARRILYLADNAGELVFDRLLLEQLPPAAVQLAVRSGPIINDATHDDARLARIPAGIEIIDPGYLLPGTSVERSSAAFQRTVREADLIISKGQGNFETLCERGDLPIFFLFMVKCEVVARNAGWQVGDAVVMAVSGPRSSGRARSGSSSL